MCLHNYRNDLHLHRRRLNSWYSGICQSLQRHLCVLGLRLPAGPHLSDTSLLLGGHQSQLPREQFRLELLILHDQTSKPHLFSFFLPIFNFLLLFFFVHLVQILNPASQAGHLQRSLLQGGAIGSVRWTFILLRFFVWNAFDSLHKPTARQSVRCWSSNSATVFFFFICQNPQKILIKTIKIMLPK